MTLSIRSSVALVAAIAVVTLLSSALVAAARDSNAPDGASQRWLPCDPWVMYHWNPVDRRVLMARLKVNERQLRDWLRIDNVRPLDELAQRKGVDPAALRAELMAPWERKLDGPALERVRKNVDAMLTQGHLAAHVLFHSFHHAGIAISSGEIFGIPLQRYLDLRNRGLSNRQLARRLGVRPATVVRRMNRVVRRYISKGRGRNLTIKSEATWLERRVVKTSKWWLDHGLEDDEGVARVTARAMRRTRGRSARVCLMFAGPDDAKHQHRH